MITRRSQVDVDPAEAGQTVQVVNFQTGAVATGAGTIPIDDTIPQVGEGNQFMSVAITPTKATNKLRIDVVCLMANGASSRVIAALFKDGAANALAAGSQVAATADNESIVKFSHFMTAGGTSTTTFTVRGGSSAGLTTFNGFSSARIYGGVAASSITVTEIEV